MPRPRQQTLAVTHKGRVVLGSSPASSRSPSPQQQLSSATRRRTIRHSFGPSTAQADDAPRDGEDVSAGEGSDEPELEARPTPKKGRSNFLEMEASETSDEGSDMDDERAHGGGRNHSDDGQAGEELVDSDDAGAGEQDAPMSDKKKGKQRAVVLSSDEDGDVQVQPPPKPSPSKPSPLKLNARPFRRTPSAFEGIIIDLTQPKSKRFPPPPGRKPAASAAKAKPKPGLFAAGQSTTEERAGPVVLPSSSSSDDDDALPTPPKKGKGKGKATSPASDSTASSASSDEGLPIPASLASQNATRRAARAPETSRKRAARRKLATLSQGVKDRRSADEASGDDEFVVGDEEEIRWDTDVEDEMESRRLEEREKGKGRKGEGKEGKGKKRARVASEEEEEEEDADAEELAPWKGKKRAADGQGKTGKGKGKEKARSPSPAASASASASDSPPPRPAKKLKRTAGSTSASNGKDTAKGKGKKKFAPSSSSSSSSSDSDSDALPHPSKAGKPTSESKSKPKQKLKKRRRPADEDEAPDDLEILDEQTVFEERFRTLKDSGAKFAALKAAREQRAAASAKNKLVVLDSEDEASPSAGPSQPRKPSQRSGPSPGAKKASQSSHKHQHKYLGAPSSESSSEGSEVSDESSSSGSSDIEDFLVDEEDEDAREERERYMEDVRGRAQGLKFYLKTYQQYLIHLIVCPEVDWLGDKDFKEAQKRVHSHLKGLVDSMVGSSAWKPRFKHAIETRPDFTVDELPKGERGAACDACTMGKNRHSLYVGTASGRKYDRKTLRYVTVSDDSSIDSSDEDSDESGPKYPEEKSFEFNLGVSCANRAEIYHQLHHWQYHTYQRMADKVRPERRPVPRPKTAGMDKAKRDKVLKAWVREKTKEAQRIGTLLDKRGIISDFANRLDKEIADAKTAFAK
ncbi:hypothetical protein JCM10207_008214 [Rhodosporidiobolus poonsookiae]